MPPDDVNNFELIMAASDGDPLQLVRILSGRVTVLASEKEYLEAELENTEITIKDQEKRIARIENMITMGRGAMIVIPIVGGILTFIIAKFDLIFAPWRSH